LDGLKYSEVAEVMNISVGAVEKNITSALKTLHNELRSFTKAN
jgi:DNA-directed RNA polymerase specialized sigma24 family protein